MSVKNSKNAHSRTDIQSVLNFIDETKRALDAN